MTMDLSIIIKFPLDQEKGPERWRGMGKQRLQLGVPKNNVIALQI